MLILAVILSLIGPSVASATTTTTRIEFTVHQRSCEIWLASESAGAGPGAGDRTDYRVERLSLPLHGPIYRAFQWLSRVKKFDLGSGFEVHGRGVGNRFAGLLGLLLRDIVEGPGAGDPYAAVIERARAEFSAHDVEVTRAALDYARGRGLGRAIEITVQVIMPNASAAQGQRMLLILPDATYPEGVLTSGSGSLPTFRRLLNVVYGGAEATNGALIRPATIREDLKRRPPSFRAIESRRRR